MYLRKLSKRLIHKSQESILLAIEILGKTTILYKAESFCIFFVNAWELLMKAYLIEKAKNSKVIFLRKKANEDRKTITLDECIRKIFRNDNNPIRKNIEDISWLRNEATHLVIPELETICLGLFQRGVLNYAKYLNKWFSKTLNVSLKRSYKSGQIDKITIKKKYGKEIYKYFDIMQTRIANNITKCGNLYCIPLNDKSISAKYRRK